MTLFSRCDTTQFADTAARSSGPGNPGPRRSRTGGEEGGVLKALSGFAEDLGILVRYAAGLDYYDRVKPRR